MKAKSLLAAALAAVTLSATAQVHVNGYMKKDGTYVAPHQRTAPNSTKLDNYSTKGNINPYTGQPGTKDPYPDTPSYAQPMQRAQPADGLQPMQPMRPMQSLERFQPVQPPQPLNSAQGF